MRFLTFTTLTVLAGGLLAAADATSVTYVKGNIDELTPNTEATLYLNNAKSMEFRTLEHTVQVPYGKISKAELGAIQSRTPETDALYKVWTLHKRFMMSPQTQEMTVAFTNEKGQNQTMTIELPKKTAAGLFATIERHSGTVADSNWWGDDYWKTNRNKDTWGGAGTIAQK
jgi:hypothetical protein